MYGIQWQILDLCYYLPPTEANGPLIPHKAISFRSMDIIDD